MATFKAVRAKKPHKAVDLPGGPTATQTGGVVVDVDGATVAGLLADGHLELVPDPDPLVQSPSHEGETFVTHAQLAALAVPIVFEVEGLLIPAGTETGFYVHTIGAISAPPGASVLATLYLELGVAPTAGDVVGLGLAASVGGHIGDFSYSIIQIECSSAVGPVGRSLHWEHVFPEAGNDLSPADALSFTPAEGGEVAVGVYLNDSSNANTADDITVVRARAAFLVI